MVGSRLRLEGDDYQDWAVVGFQVKDLAGELLHQGMEKWTFEARHIPWTTIIPTLKFGLSRMAPM